MHRSGATVPRADPSLPKMVFGVALAAPPQRAWTMGLSLVGGPLRSRSAVQGTNAAQRGWAYQDVDFRPHRRRLTPRAWRSTTGPSNGWLLAATVMASGCFQTQEFVRIICPSVLVEFTPAPGARSSLGFSADEAAAGFAFTGQANVAYDERLPEALASMTRSYSPSGMSGVLEVQSTEYYNEDRDGDQCPIGQRRLRTRGTLVWSLDGHVAESRSATIDFFDVGVSEEFFPTDDHAAAPIEPWLRDMVLDEVPCDDLRISSSVEIEGVTTVYDSTCDGGYRAGEIFIATPIHDTLAGATRP
jgi:hypothetical protein